MTKTWVLMQGRSSAGLVIAATLLLSMATNKTHGSVQDTPVSLTSSSWNADVVYASSSWTTDSAVAFDGQYAWDAYGSAPSGAYLSMGLPESRDSNGDFTPTLPTLFSSAYTDAVTGTATQFEFQPFQDANNVNLFQNGTTGATLSLNKATAFDNIAILAASANSENGYVTIDMTLHFANGSESSLISYNVYDWSRYAGAAGNQALPYPGVDRSTASSGGTLETQSHLDADNLGDFQMYETDFNLESLGYSNNAITSVSFSAPAAGDVGIFALSGYANPTQPLPVQPTAPDPAVTLPGSLPLTFSGGTLLALAAIGRRFARLRWPMIR